MSPRDIALRTDKLLARVEGGIGWLTFNHPERRNAISLEMWAGLGDALEAFQHDDAVRVVVMKGAGGKAFASGADISEFGEKRANAEQRRQYGEVAEAGRAWLGKLDKPLIAMIQGYCIGGGLAVSLSADLRFACEGSTFGIPAARLGLGYDYGGVAALARLVGPSTARDMLFSARFMQADEALRIGLVNFVVPEAELEARVRDYAETVAANAPLTVRAAKAAVNVYERYSRTEAAAPIAQMIDACFNSDDYAEGRRAFAEKRKPQFKGR
ncbi:MAG: enoyl-CoA hydratase/isomerase family protein [Rhizobacter sp.]|nr:enoyl-CoA hydratase/isomerase family protein [Rhizobacter sp.]